MRLSIRLALVTVAVVVVVGCGGEQDTSSTADATSTAPPPPVAQIAYLIAAAGDVRAGAGGSAVEAELGEPVGGVELVVVGEESYADIQFGDKAVARIFGPARASTSSTLVGNEIAVMEIFLHEGAIAAKVNALDENEAFRVRTDQALYVVQGTEFALQAGGAEELAVAEGEVKVYPALLDTIAVVTYVRGEPKLRPSGDELDPAARGLDTSAVTVGANRQVVLNPAELDKSNRLADQLQDKLRQVDAADEAQAPSLVDDLLEIIRLTSDSLPGIVTSREAPSAELAEKLAAIDELRLLPVSKDPQNLALLETEDGGNLVKFTLRTVPQGADIYIGGTLVGESVYRGVFRANESISIRVAREGYRERRIQIDRARSEVLTVQLERLPPSISAASFLKAIEADDLETVRTYVREGGSVNVRTSDAIPAVVLASGLIPVLKGQTPDLSYQRDVFGTIVAANADLDASFVVEGATFKLLHAAVLVGVAGFDVTSMVALVMEAGASVDSTIVLEGEELTALAIAVRWALYTGETQEEIIKLLIQSGASLDVAITFNDEILTLKEIASELVDRGELDDPELIRLLRQAGLTS